MAEKVEIKYPVNDHCRLALVRHRDEWSLIQLDVLELVGEVTTGDDIVHVQFSTEEQLRDLKIVMDDHRIQRPNTQLETAILAAFDTELFLKLDT